jgi:cyclopropane-fatty-acyl-phospholipid synthase
MPDLASTARIHSLEFLDALFRGSPPEEVGFRLWDGTPWPDPRPRAATLVLAHPGALRAMFSTGTELALAEAHLEGHFDVEGDIETACDLADVLEHRPGGWRTAWADYRRLHRLPEPPRTPIGWRVFERGRGRAGSRARARAAISFHYDVSNAFYQLWLDRRMLYSCAYFTDVRNDLDTAQEAKLHHLCRKLRLRPGQRLLDVGCGWGGLVVLAAREYGVQATGITLSVRQAELARERAEAAGVSDRVRIVLRDYRELPAGETFDAIVSVGMSEHVGAAGMTGYFRAVSAVLRPGGVFLNHAIGQGVRPRGHRGPSFIDRHVFPDADIPPLPAVAAAAEDAGLEVRDVENLREHYALTLRHWVRRLEARREEARREVDEPTYRTWRLYMAGSAHGFARSRLALYQVLLSKNLADGTAGLPPTRADWYSRL